MVGTGHTRADLVTQHLRAHPTNPYVPFESADREQSIPQRFEQQVSHHADRLAVQGPDRTWTYQALNQMANRVAWATLTRCGDGNETVALLFGHGAQMIAALMGVLKAGKIYVPIDPAHPRARSAHILDDAQVPLIIADHANLNLALEMAQGRDVLQMEEVETSPQVGNPALVLSPDTYAYLLYTSGSTGQPKGVVENHRDVLHFTMVQGNSSHMCPKDRYALVSSLSFSGAASQIYPTLLNGASLWPFDLRQEGIEQLAGWLAEKEITLYSSVPTVFRRLCSVLDAEGLLSALRMIQLGGDRIDPQDIALFKKHFPHCILRVGLGASECKIMAQYMIDNETELPGNRVPVGYAVQDTEILLLGPQGPVGPGEVGEIAVQSRYVCPGYWRRPDLTAERFLPDPDGGDRRIYLTGDMGRMDPDGCLYHLGRKDFQVKIHGYRVEVAEIEGTLLNLGSVREAAVIARQDRPGDPTLVAYLVPAVQPAPTITSIRHALASTLPDYMIPSAFVILDAMPLNPNGKVDRAQLPVPDRGRPDLDASFVAPRDDVERQLAKMWERILDVEPVGVQDNFFELGGDSVLAATLLARLGQTMGYRCEMPRFFQAPTVEQLAELVRAKEEKREASLSSLVPLRTNGSQPPLFCLPGNMGNVHTDLSHLARHMGPDRPIYGLQDGIQNPARVQALAARYVEEIVAVQPAGPYLLAGICSGGPVAFEMAQQLGARGEQVALLALIEPSSLYRSAFHRHIKPVLSIVRRLVRRAGHHSRMTLKPGSIERRTYLGLRAKVVANIWAAAHYVARPYPGRIELFMTRSSLQVPQNPQMNWRAVAVGGVRLHEIPGTHETVTGDWDANIDEEAMCVVAQQLEACIGEAQVGYRP
jgi:amino acid adenylation domain-containing protein